MTHWQKGTGEPQGNTGPAAGLETAALSAGSFQGRRTGNCHLSPDRRAGGHPAPGCARDGSVCVRLWPHRPAGSWLSRGCQPGPCPNRTGGGQMHRVRTPAPLCRGRPATDRRHAPAQHPRSTCLGARERLWHRDTRCWAVLLTAQMNVTLQRGPSVTSG